MQVHSPKRHGIVFWLLLILAVLAGLLLLSPAAAAGAGRVLGDIWVSTMGAVFGLIGGLFGG